MSDHFIREIAIKRFKCFDNFKAQGFGRVNLIGGKNNVGKTAFMEACYVNVQAQSIESFTGALTGIKFMRENLNLLTKDISENIKKFIEQSNHISISSNKNEIHYEIEERQGIKEYSFTFLNNKVKVNVKEYSFEARHTKSIIFIDNFGLANSEIIECYAYLQRKDKEADLNAILAQFDPNIKAFKIFDDKPHCKANNTYREITEFGDGLRHLVSIVTSLYAAENGYLFIDEVDNGIHYTLLNMLWEHIFVLSKKLNVQVFATTHSKECIESFSQVQEKITNDDNTLYFEMAKEKKTNKIFMRDLDSKQLHYELSHQGKYRGE